MGIHAMNIKLKFNINALSNYNVHLMSMTSTRRKNNVKNVHPNILIRLWNFRKLLNLSLEFQIKKKID